MAFYLLFGPIVLTFACVSFFFARFLLGGKRYAEKGTSDYERITLGNPLAAFFKDSLLTHEGLKLRSQMVIVIGLIWGVCFVISFVINI